LQVLDVTETFVISEESSSSDLSKSGGNSDNAGAGTEIVELVSLDELPSSVSKKARHESEADLADDDDISQLMSETGVVMVTDEKSHVTRESVEAAGGLEVQLSDDEGTDSCEEFEGFSVMSSRDQTPDRPGQLTASSMPLAIAGHSNQRSLTPPGTRPGPPPLTRVEYNRGVSWDKHPSDKQSPLLREGPPVLLHSPTSVNHPKPVYPRPTMQSTPVSHMYPLSSTTTTPVSAPPRRFLQMKRQASQLTQNIKGSVKKTTQ
jgi:hypothetical protein